MHLGGGPAAELETVETVAGVWAEVKANSVAIASGRRGERCTIVIPYKDCPFLEGYLSLYTKLT